LLKSRQESIRAKGFDLLNQDVTRY
jgi:hypothetical protein